MNKYYHNLGLVFEALVENKRNNRALLYVDKVISYGEINALSNKIASYLLSKKIVKSDVVGIINTKEPVSYATMIACLKIGAIYTNIDEENPAERLRKIFVSCCPKIIITDQKPTDKFQHTTYDLEIELVDFSVPKEYENYSDKNIQSTGEVVGSNPAYIMFTSGSTGSPKGVLISHQNIINFIYWSINNYNVTSDDIFAHVNPIYFDNSVFDFYTSLFSGASLAPVTKKITKNPAELVSLIDKLQCTIWFSVPSLLVYLLTMKVLSRSVLNTVRVFTFGGEGFPKGELKKLYDLYGDDARLVNVYGPTEGTCICSSYDISKNDFLDMSSLAPLGHINKNFDYIIVDKDMKAVTQGKKGELCLVGPNVGVGYYNDLEKTNKSFVQNPTIISYRDIIYKTGDLVFEKDGLLYFSGRIDNQIKHMGYRIELEEIESALNGLVYVNQSAVIYNRVNSKYGKIIAFIASREIISEENVKKDLLDYLPDYMVPNIVVVQKDLPKNANGKIDKKALLGAI